jgi:cobalt-zinc-cadmium efflux system outer membrane protein
MRTALILLILILVRRHLSAQQAVDVKTAAIPVTSALINQLSEEARTNNPALRSAAENVNAASANVRSIRTWEDPTFMAGGVAASRSMRKEEGDIAFGVEQRLPLFGKPKLARNVAQAEAATEQAKADFQFQMLRLELVRQLLKTALADHGIDIGSQDLAWVESTTTAVEDHYHTGAATQPEVLRMLNERSKRSQQLRTDISQRDQERMLLNRLLNRTLEQPWPKLTLPQVAKPVVYNELLKKMTLESEAKLGVMRRALKQAEASIISTKRSRLPEVSLGLEGRQYSGDGEFREGMFTLRLSLPWFNRDKYRSDLERERSKLKAAQLEVADYELFVPTEASRLTVRIDAARREALVYRDEIIPRAELALNSARSAWATNRGMFLDLLEARRMLLESRLTYGRAVAEQYQLLAELALYCGVGDLEALEILGSP